MITNHPEVVKARNELAAMKSPHDVQMDYLDSVERVVELMLTSNQINKLEFDLALAFELAGKVLATKQAIR